MKIFKYPLIIDDYQNIPMPRGARILCVQPQGGVRYKDDCIEVETEGQPCIWAAVNPGGDLVKRRFRVVGTGHDADDLFHPHSHQFTAQFNASVAYVGTFQQAGGALVWHVFDLGEAP